MMNIFSKFKFIFEKGAKFIRQAYFYKKGGLAYNSLMINITSLCNSNCGYCDVKSLNPADNLTGDEIRRILTEAKEMGINNITFSGGEPFVHEGIWDLIDFAKGLGIKLSVITNGLLLNEFDGEKLLKLKGLNRLFVSLDSFNPGTHDRLRGGAGFFSKTVNGIKKARENGIDVAIASVVSSENYRELPKFIDFAGELGVKYITFQPVHVWSNFGMENNSSNPSKLIVNESEIKILTAEIKKAIRHSKNKNVNTNLPALVQWIGLYFAGQDTRDRALWFKDIASPFKCKEIFTNLFINHNGGLIPCAMLSARANVQGKKLADAVKSLEGIKDDIKKGRFPEECRKCSCQAGSNFIFSIFTSPFKNSGKLITFLKDVL